MDLKIFEKLHDDGLIGEPSLEKVRVVENGRLFSLYWELKTLLYLGVVLLSSGLGILVYKNIETIGHRVVLLFIALVFCGCFYYCIRKKKPFSFEKVEAPDPFFDYILLLGCLSFISFIAYLQFQYAFFGNAYGLATFIPMVVLFVCAYYFDHIGILSLAITNLAAWAGISITPLRILKENAFSDERLIYTGIVLGMILLMAGVASQARNFKKHFEFTYTNFGMHLVFIASLAGMFTHDAFYFLWFLWVMGVTALFYRQALKRRSFYFLLIIILYAYVAISYLVIRLLDHMSKSDMGIFYAGFLYFILSAIAVLRLLIFLNRKIKAHDRL